MSPPNTTVQVRIETALRSRVTALSPMPVGFGLLGFKVELGDGRLLAIKAREGSGHAEIELAFATMFGTFGRAFFEAYEAQRPLEPGFHKLRASLYKLYPTLVHVRLFGAGLSRADRAPAGEARPLRAPEKRTGPGVPGRSSLRNEPNSKGIAFMWALARPPILFRI
jgi:hypothetical protein